jgi:hypothetical protein
VLDEIGLPCHAATVRAARWYGIGRFPTFVPPPAAHRRVTIVPVTHDIDQAVNLAERVLVFASLPERRTVDALIRPERS